MRPIQKPRVLIAEDDYLVSETIKRALKELDYELVGKTSDGVEAVEMACTVKPDVVLMDIQMPELDGLEATRQIQSRCPMPVVVLTAHESQELVEKASEVGVSAYLIKPPKHTEIERAITIALARHDDLMACRELKAELETQKEKLEKALAEIKTLRGILPICASCKNIRDDKGYWNQIEVYIRDHSEAEFTHGICPECAKKLYPDLDLAPKK
jgi:AmiR/NasT family two-component response regulator